MVALRVEQDKLRLSCQYQHKNQAKAVPGARWNKKDRVWQWKWHRRTVAALMDTFGDQLNIDSEVLDRAAAEQQALEKSIAAKQAPDAKIDVSYANQLRPYQRVGTKWLADRGRALLADDMGTGKTVQTIGACTLRDATAVLVVCPASVKWSWFKEVHKWLNQEATVAYGTKAVRTKIVEGYESGYMIINYEALRLHPELLKRRWDAVVIDEAHRIKNRKAKTTEVIGELKSDALYLLTGTPMLNRAQELWSLLNVLWPKEYSSYWNFVDSFCEVIDGDWGKEINVGSTQQLRLLQHELAPLMIRRTKAEVLPDLPAKVYQRQVVELGAKQQKIYDEMADKALTILDSEKVVVAPIVIAQITRLRQLAISPKLIGESDIIGSKAEAVVELIQDNIEGHKIVVFSQFKGTVALVGQLLTEAAVPWVSVTGDVDDADRKEATERIQNDPNTRVMLATIEAAGLGVTWTSADIAVFTDRHWTPGVNTQAEDRLHRIGQEGSVTIVNLVAKNTIEEDIEHLLDSKDTDIQSVLQDKEALRLALTRKEN